MTSFEFKAEMQSRRDSALKFLQKSTFKILEKPNTENLRLFLSDIRELPDETVRELQRYLIFPAVSLLKQRVDSRSELKELCFVVLNEVLSRSKLSDWNRLRDIIGCLCVLLKDYVVISTSTKEDTTVDEIFGVKLLVCLNTAARACETAVFVEAFERAKSQVDLLWSHMVFGCVELIKKNAGRDMNLAALELMEQLVLYSQIASGLQSLFEPLLFFAANERERKSLGSLYASFLPGISAACTGIVKPTGGYPGRRVIVQSLRTLSAVIRLIFEDKQSVFTKPAKKSWLEEKELSGNKDLERTTVEEFRTNKWLEATLSKLAVVFRNLLPILHNESPEARIALAVFAGEVISSCFGSLSKIIPVLARMLVVLSEDDHSELKKIAAAALLELQTILLADEFSSVWDLLQEDLITIMDSLPSLLQSNDQQELVYRLKACCGYLVLIGPALPPLLRSGDIAGRFLTTLVAICEFDMKMFDFIGFGTGQEELSEPVCRFKYLDDKQNFHLFRKICSLLAVHGIDGGFFLPLITFVDGNYPQNPALMTLNLLLRGISAQQPVEPEKNAVCEDLAAEALQHYISSDLWNFTTSTQAAVLSRRCIVDGDSWQPKEDHNIVILKENLLGLCLRMEGIAILAEILGTRFIPKLYHTLYHLLDKTEAEMPLVRNRAICVLKSIAASCGYESVSEMVTVNTEYVVNDIVLKLRHLPRNPKAAVTLRALLNHVRPTVLSLVIRIVRGVMEKLDEFHSMAALPFIGVLGAVVSKFKEWFPPAPEPKMIAFDSVKEALEYLKQGHFSDPSLDEVSECEVERERKELEEECSDVLEEQKENEIPEYVQITVEVLNRCSYLLPVNDRNLRSAVLDVLTAGCEVLQPWKDQLLPVVHKIWQSIILLHRCPDHIIIRKAFSCLHVMSKAAGSFLRYRITKEIFPLIARFLAAEAMNSAKYKNNPHDPVIRLQLSFLTISPKILNNTDAEDTTCDLLAGAALLYLDVGQPQILRQAAESFFIDLSLSHPELVAVRMLEVQSSLSALSFSRPGLPTVKRMNPDLYAEMVIEEKKILDAISIIKTTGKAVRGESD